MNKKFIAAFGITVIGMFAGYNIYCIQNKTPMSDLALANVEALADGDENGTKVGSCYLEITFSTTSGYKEFCDKETSNDKIYPCPSRTSYGGYSDMSKDRCTK